MDDLPSDLHALLETITTGLSSASSVLPQAAPETPHGLSLLDLKSSILLSYLQNLSLLTLSKLSNPSLSLQTPESERLLWNLVQDRMYLEKGVAPLELKLGYQIRKLIRAARDSGADENLRFKPNPAALVESSTKEISEKTGVYKPPRISSTALPTSRDGAGPRRNKVLEEFISSSLVTAPTAIPSVGSNVSGITGRNAYKTSRNDDIEQYEEENFNRLPANIGKDKEKGKKRRARDALQGLGGEDWSGLEKLGTGDWRFGHGEGKLERSRKRGFHESVNSGAVRDDGVSGREFEKRKKVLQNRKFKTKHRGGKR